jgi:dihydropyrimidine dehydrogenase (NAD+) subunit PreT
MHEGQFKEGIAGGRLAPSQYADNFSDLHPPLDHHEALVESDRCYFCYDAPCMNACPTAIDIPLFIREIATGNPIGSAKTIFDQNILGGMCARVCPTETLCEEACVREAAEGKPVKIGLLQRYATDKAMSQGKQFYARAESTGKSIAVVGAGPAGLACAHRLAMKGHEVQIFEARPKPGGLNEYGIAAYKAVGGFAQSEVDYITAIGGITIHHGRALGDDGLSLTGLASQYDAVFLAMGLGGVNALGLPDSEAPGSDDAIDWIAGLRQASDLGTVAVGRRVVVIGGGMTAVDAGVQAKGLGAEEVTICYRGPRERMKASEYEQELAQTRGVSIRCEMQPKRLVVEGGRVAGVEFARGGETVLILCDQVFKAIGQTLDAAPLTGPEPLALDGGRIRVDAEGRTSHPKVWAGGDCVAAGDDLTVTAAAQGRDAAESIHRALGA